jgi:WD40 repeat protein
MVLRPKGEGTSITGSPLVRPDGRQVLFTTYRELAGRAPYGLLAWDLETGAEPVAFEGHAAPITFARYSPDSRYVVSASQDMTARLWDARTGREVAVLKCHTAGLESASFGPAGEWVVTAGRDRTARLWHAPTGKEQATFLHTAIVFSATVSSDGKRVLTLTEDGEARLWPVNLLSAAEGRKPREPTPEEREAFELGTGR